MAVFKEQTTATAAATAAATATATTTAPATAADNKTKKEQEKPLSFFEALQHILVYSKETAEYKTASEILLTSNVTANTLDAESSKCLKALFKNKLPKLPLGSDLLAQIPNLFGNLPDSAGYNLLCVVLRGLAKPPEKLSKNVLAYFQRSLSEKNNNLPDAVALTMVLVLLEIYYGEDAGCLVKEEEINLNTENNKNLEDARWRKIKELEDIIRQWLCSDGQPPEKFGNIPPALIAPLNRLKQYLTHPDRQLRLLARDMCENFKIPLDLPRMLSLSVDGIVDPSGPIEELVLILGPTGVGKSTLGNCLTGTKYVRVKDGYSERLIPESGQSGPARVGHGWTSQTLYPQIIRGSVSNISTEISANTPSTSPKSRKEGEIASDNNNNDINKSKEASESLEGVSQKFACADLPGFQETRTDDRGICAAISVPLTVYSDNINTRAVIVVLPHSMSIPNYSARGETFRQLSLTLFKMFKDPQKLGKDGRLLFVVARPPLPEYNNNESFETDAIRTEFRRQMLELRKSRARDFSAIQGNFINLKKLENDMSALEICRTILEGYLQGDALKVEKSNPISQFFHGIAGNKERLEKGKLALLIEEQCREWEKRGVSKDAIDILKPAFGEILGKENQYEQQNEILRQMSRLTEKKDELQKQYNKLKSDNELLEAERTILDIIASREDNIFIFRGYTGQPGDEPDDTDRIRRKIVDLGNQNKIAKGEFLFDPKSKEFSKVSDWVETLSSEVSPILRGVVRLPKEVDDLNASINRTEADLVKSEKDLKDTILTQDWKESKLIADLKQTIADRKKQIAQLTEENKNLDEANARLAKRKQEIEAMPMMEFKSQRFSQRRTEFFSSCSRSTWNYTFPGRDGNLPIPIAYVEIGCAYNESSKTLIFREKKEIVLEGDVSNITVDPSAYLKNHDGVLEAHRDGYEESGQFTINECNLNRGDLRLTYTSRAGIDGNAAVRTFVLPKYIPVFRREIEEIDRDFSANLRLKNTKNDEIVQTNIRLKYDEEYLELVQSKLRHDPDDSVMRVKTLLHLLGRQKNEFIQEFFAEIRETCGWLEQGKNFDLLQKIKGCTREQFNEMIGLDLDSRAYSALLMGPGFAASVQAVLPPVSEQVCTEFTKSMPNIKEFFKQLAVVSAKTRLPIRSIRDLLVWDLGKIEGEPLPERLKKLKYDRNQLQHLFEVLRETYRGYALRIAALHKIESVFKFSKNNSGIRRCLEFYSEVLKGKSAERIFKPLLMAEREAARKTIIENIGHYVYYYNLSRQLLLAETPLSLTNPNEQHPNAAQESTQNNANSTKTITYPNPMFSGISRPEVLGDGNCALNAVALGLCDFIKEDSLRDQTIYRTLCKALKISVENRMGLMAWLERNKDSDQRQRMLAPVIRRLAVEYIEAHYEHFEESYREGLVAAFGLYRAGRRDEETFYVHEHIKTKFASLNEQIKANAKTKEDKDSKELSEEQITKDLTDWWKAEGAKSYFEVMKRPASNALDFERWGSEVEIGAFAYCCGFTVKCRKNGSLHILGIGYGMLQGLFKNDIWQLEALNVGSRFQGGFRIEIADRAQLERLLNQEGLSETERKSLDEQGKNAILAFKNKNDNTAKIPGIDDLNAFCRKLVSIGVLIVRPDQTVRFVNPEQLEVLVIPVSADLKRRVFEDYLPNVPCFEVTHDGLHWSYGSNNDGFSVFNSESPSKANASNASNISNVANTASDIKVQAEGPESQQSHSLLANFTKQLLSAGLINDGTKEVSEKQLLAIVERAFEIAKGWRVHIFSENELPNKLEETHAPAVISKTDGNFELIVNGKKGVEKVKTPVGIDLTIIKEFCGKNKERKEVTLSWETQGDIMKVFTLAGHISSHDKHFTLLESILLQINTSEQFARLKLGNKNWLYYLYQITSGPLAPRVRESIKVLVKLGESPYVRDANNETIFKSRLQVDPDNISALLLPQKLPEFVGVESQVKRMGEFFEQIKAKPGTNNHFLLLSGPPGVGKTKLVEVLSKLHGFGDPLVYKMGNRDDMWRGGLETRVQEFFDQAKKRKGPICLLMDEIDVICPETPDAIHSSSVDKITDIIQTEITALKDSEAVLVGASNFLSRVKEAIKNRAGTPVMFNLPRLEHRRRIIEHTLRLERLADVNIIDNLAEATSGWSPRLLKDYLDQVMNKAKLDNRDSITVNDFIEFFEDMRKSIQDQQRIKLHVDLTPPSLKLVSNPDFGSKMVGLNPTVKKALGMICAILEDPEGYPDNNNLLLEGPPGTGKTLFAKTVADHSNTACIYIDPKIASTVTIQNSFEAARSYEKAIIFIDEVDAIAYERSPFQKLLQTEMDGFKTKDKTNIVVIIGATNEPDNIADAVMSRFPSRTTVPLPNEEQRAALFRFYILKSIKNKDFDSSLKNLEDICHYLAEITQYFAGRDINSAVDKAIRNSRYDASQNKKQNENALGQKNTKSYLTRTALEEACLHQADAVNKRMRKYKGGYPVEYLGQQTITQLTAQLNRLQNLGHLFSGAPGIDVHLPSESTSANDSKTDKTDKTDKTKAPILNSFNPGAGVSLGGQSATASTTATTSATDLNANATTTRKF